ncbi:MAG: serine protease AprX [Planctomycetota bacterium]|jgi:serine protease AprX
MLKNLPNPSLLACLLIAPIAAQIAVPQQSQATDIRLRYASFDPLVAQPKVPTLLRGTNENGLWIVQFQTTPTQADRNAMAELGGQVIGYLPDNAYVVRMPAGPAANTMSIETVRWVGSYEVPYRMDPALLLAKAYASDKPANYRIVVADRNNDKPTLVMKITAAGGQVVAENFGSSVIEATLTGPQMLLVAGFNEVLWVDPAGELKFYMDNARIQGGGNYVEGQAGYTGTGVNSHIYEGVEAAHLDFTGGATNVLSAGNPTDHGHATGGIMWGNGNSNPAVRGMAPDSGKFYTEVELPPAAASRWQVFSDLVNVHDVSHTSGSWGWGITLNYNSYSAEADEAVFDHDIAWTQSQANDGTQMSDGFAWGKNVFSIGGVAHGDDANPANDSWLAGSASIGPASDGRIKPTLCAYFDFIGTSDRTGAAGYSGMSWTGGFNGTSGAGPIVGGHNVIAIQMFTDDAGTPGIGKFGNALRVPGGTAHQNRPHFTTLKSLMVTAARQYAFTSASNDLRREHQGWGFPNLQDLWDRRGKTFLIDETEVMQQGAVHSYQITVAPSEAELKISLNWNEPAANPSAAADLINNLSLRVLAPNGTEYWGNIGLEDGPWSQAGGSEDSINSIENVFIQNPAAGNWYVQVLGTSIVADNHVETQAVDADYGLVCVGGVGQVAPPGVFGEAESIGFGCDGSTCVDAIYEYPTFSLANSSITFEHVGVDYVLQPGQGNWIPAAGQNLGMADNTEVVKNLAFTLAYPGGSTSSLRVCSNGWISSGLFTGTSNLVPDPDDFLAQTMWAPLWHDLNPGAGGSVWFDSTSQRAVVTWVTVPNFFNSGASTFQVQFWANGDVHFIYQNMTIAGDYVTGFSRSTSNDPGSSNLASAAGSGVGVCTTLQPELKFDVSARPVLGTTFDLVTTEIPVGTYFGLAILSTTQLPAVSLTFLGLPGCQLYQTIDVSVLWAQVGNSGIVQWPLPNNPVLAGFETFCQSATLTPGINAFGMAVSNGLKLVVGFN